MIPVGQLTGAVLAGGESRRMSRDKAGLIIDHIPLWQRQVDLLRVAGAGVIAIVRRPDQVALGLCADTPLWLDTVAGIGPLAGLHVALQRCPTDWLAVAAVDMPHLDAGWFEWLGSYCTNGRGGIARRPDGRFEPLAAIYPQAALDIVTKQVTGTDHSLQSLATALIEAQLMVSLPVPETELPRLKNWNTPGDLASMG